jgi:hypothetical protein
VLFCSEYCHWQASTIRPFNHPSIESVIRSGAPTRRRLCHVYKRMSKPGSHSYGAERISLRSGILKRQGNRAMMKNLACANVASKAESKGRGVRADKSGIRGRAGGRGNGTKIDSALSFVKVMRGTASSPSVTPRGSVPQCSWSTASIGPCKPFACRGILRRRFVECAVAHGIDNRGRRGPLVTIGAVSVCRDSKAFRRFERFQM